MPYAAAETMMAHEAMQEKINLINHFSMYYEQCQDQQLKQLLDNHLHIATRAYNELVNYMQKNKQPEMAMPPMRDFNPNIQYGLRNPSPQAPQMNMNKMDDRQIAMAMLLCHKNSAKNSMAHSLECADQTLREMLMNSAIQCNRDAYETFIMMNQKGWYQIPTMKGQTTRTFMQSYQPTGQQMPAGQTMGNMNNNMNMRQNFPGMGYSNY